MIRLAAILVILAGILLIFSGCSSTPKLEIPDQEVDEGQSLTLSLEEFVTKDQDGSHTFAIVTGTGFIRGGEYTYSPAYGDAGKHSVTIRARNANGKTSDNTFNIFVNEINTPPVVTTDDQVVLAGEELSIDLLEFVADAEGDGVSLSKVEGPGEIIEGRYFVYWPLAEESGEHVILLEAEDHRGAVSKGRFTVSVIEPAPVIFKIDDQEIAWNEALIVELKNHLQNVRTPPERFVVEEGPGSVSYDGKYELDGASTEFGEHKVVIAAHWDSGLEAIATFRVAVGVQPSPLVEIPVISLTEGGDHNINLSQFVENLDLFGQVVFTLVDGPGALEEGNLYSLAGHRVSPGLHRVVFEVDADGVMTVAEVLVNILVAASDTGRTLVVGGIGEEQFDTIQKALDAARHGDTILITPGEYVENIQILKAVTIRGQSRDDVILRPENLIRPCIVIRAGGFHLSSITIETSTRAIQLSTSSGELSNSRIIAGRPGVTFIGSGGDLVIRDTEFFSYLETDHEGEINSHLVALHAYGSGRVTVENSLFERCGTGMLVGSSIEFSILDNLFRGNTIAVSLTGSSGGLFQGNHVTGSFENGLLLNTSSEVTVVDNYFYANRLHGLDLYLRMCTICRCGGTVFRGTVLGSGNVFDDPKGICPVEEHDWPEAFYAVDPELSRRFAQEQ